MTGDTQGDKSETEVKPVIYWSFKEHLPLMITGLSVLFIGIRLLSVSNYNFETADGILQSSGTTTVALGALIPVIGFIFLVAAMWLLQGLMDNRIETRSRQLVWLAIISFLAFAVFTAPAAAIVIMGIVNTLPILLLLCFTVVLALWAKGSPSDRLERIGKFVKKSGKMGEVFGILSRYQLIVATIAFSLILATNSVPWMPAERITIANSSHPIVGYVVGESQTDTSILTLSRRLLIHVDPNTITTRSICSQSGVGYSGFFVDPLPEIIGSRDISLYPPCPK